jgi:hypothetical protein
MKSQTSATENFTTEVFVESGLPILGFLLLLILL